VRSLYTYLLIRVLRAPKRALSALLALFALAGCALALNWVAFELLPQNPSHGIEVTLEMPTGTPTEQTLAKLEEIERRITPLFKPGELRASAIESGAIVKEGTYLYGHQCGDIWFSLTTDSNRDAATLLPLVKPLLEDLSGAVGVWVEGDGPEPVGKPIYLMLSGAGGSEQDAAIIQLKAILGSIAGVHDIKIDIIAGLPELNVRLDSEAIRRAGLNPESVIRTLQLLADGESVASFINQDESIGVRVRADEGEV
jgi:multidrug efflux pump subunit AcrB